MILGFYGQKCDLKCKTECGGKCDRVLGECTCPEGFYGPDCRLACPHLAFGPNCRKKCDCNSMGTESCHARVSFYFSKTHLFRPENVIVNLVITVLNVRERAHQVITVLNVLLLVLVERDIPVILLLDLVSSHVLSVLLDQSAIKVRL